MLWIISFYFYQSKLGFYTFLQLVKDEMWPTITLTYQGDLGDPNFNCIAIVIPRFSWATSVLSISN